MVGRAGCGGLERWITHAPSTACELPLRAGSPRPRWGLAESAGWSWGSGTWPANNPTRMRRRRAAKGERWGRQAQEQHGPRGGYTRTVSAGEGVWKAVEVRRFFSFQSAAVESAERLASGDGVLENGTPLVKELEGGKPLCMMWLVDAGEESSEPTECGEEMLFPSLAFDLLDASGAQRGCCSSLSCRSRPVL